VRGRGLVPVDLAGRSIRDVSYREGEGRKAVAAIVADDEIALWWTDSDGGSIGLRCARRPRRCSHAFALAT